MKDRNNNNNSRLRFPRRGFSLFEIMISFFLFALIAGSVLIIYTGMFKSTTRVTTHLEPLNQLEVLARIFQERSHESVYQIYELDVPRSASQKIGGYIYTVEDLSILENPVNPAHPGPNEENCISMRRLRIHLYYYAIDFEGKETPAGYEEKPLEYTTTLFVEQ